MTRIKLDDAFADHPKIADLSDRAFRVHITALLYCGKYLTDGVIPEPIANRFCVSNARRIISKLTDTGLWKVVEGGYEINDYLKYQTSKAQAEMEKETNRLRAAKARKLRAEALRNGVTTTERSSTEAHTPTPTPTDIKKNSLFDLKIELKEAFELCEMLVELIRKNGNKEPKITKSWIQDMNRIMTIDERTPLQIKFMIKWSQEDPFWCSNILSPASLRAKFDQMRLKSPLSGFPQPKDKPSQNQSSPVFEATPTPPKYVASEKPVRSPEEQIALQKIIDEAKANARGSRVSA